MESQEDFSESLPYIDDTLNDDDNNPRQYNLKIIENYQNKNRNIEITNRLLDDMEKSLSPGASLPDELSDYKMSDSTEEDTCKNEIKFRAKEPGMKLVVKGWSSSVSIQGLDHKSSITFKRRCEKVHRKLEKDEKSRGSGEELKAVEKSKKGKWKRLTSSIMLAKSARLEKRGLDERYPKYVLLKNEDEELTPEKENYPKMFVFSDGNPKQKRNSESKTEFSFKKSFKNKTEPLNDISSKTETSQNGKPEKKPKETTRKQKKALTERSVNKKKTTERRKSPTTEKSTGEPTQSNMACPFPYGQVYSEIQNIIEDTLKLSSQTTETQQNDEAQHQAEKHTKYYTPMPAHFPCHSPHCCMAPHQLGHSLQKGYKYKNSNTQIRSQYPSHNQEARAEDPNEIEGVLDLETFPYGILSSFFPRVVIMNAIPGDEITTNEPELVNYQILTEIKKDPSEENPKASESSLLEVPQQDLTLKSKVVQEIKQPETQDCSLKEISELDEEEKTKSQDSLTTEYLQYSEFDPPENESVERQNPITPPARHESEGKEDKSLPPEDKFKIDDIDENSENLSLTKIGYKMYDNLTKLSLNREKEMSQKPEASGCGCNGNETKKSPYNITLESNNSVVKVTVPENELNFQIFNSKGNNIQIGVMSGGGGGKEEQNKAEMKKIVRKEDFWHTDNDQRAVVLKNENSDADSCQKFKVTLADNKEVVLSIETNEKGKKEEKRRIEKYTREMKVGTDDFDLAGGDFVCTSGENYQNLSPRIEQLLKHLHEKLEEQKFLNENFNQKLLDRKFQERILPGVFLVKHLSPKPHAPKKLPQVSSAKKPKSESQESAGQLREYYCEECLATMRIFEDEKPSVKSMVDKFETIIQLESY